jgi:hypothetical protein
MALLLSSAIGSSKQVGSEYQNKNKNYGACEWRGINDDALKFADAVYVSYPDLSFGD